MRQGVEFIFEQVTHLQEDYFLTGFAPRPLFKASLFKKGVLRAYCYLHLSQEARAISLPQLPFGGIWILKQVNFELLEEWVAFIQLEVSRLNCQSLTFIQPPTAYEPFSDGIQYLLSKMGFTLDSLLNHQLLLGKEAMQQANCHFFSNKIMTDPQISIRTEQFEGLEPLERILRWNQLKGYSPTLSLERLSTQISQFPQRYYLISIHHQGKAVAHSVALQLTARSLFYAYSGFEPQAKIKNLGACMLEQLITLGLDLNVDFLDLGSSDLGTQANHSLIFFKSKFANAYQNKTAWTKQLIQ